MGLTQWYIEEWRRGDKTEVKLRSYNLYAILSSERRESVAVSTVNICFEISPLHDHDHRFLDTEKV